MNSIAERILKVLGNVHYTLGSSQPTREVRAPRFRSEPTQIAAVLRWLSVSFREAIL